MMSLEGRWNVSWKTHGGGESAEQWDIAIVEGVHSGPRYVR